MAIKVDRTLRKQRIFRDRTSQLDTLTDSELMSRYRMPRHALIQLFVMIRPEIEHPTKRSRALFPETQFLVTIRYLAKGFFLMELGDLHGVHESSVSRCLHRTVNAIVDALDNIKFRPEENAQRMSDFHKVAGFPRIIGAIDGTLVPIKRPPTDEEVAYVCRKGYHSINVQAVCDANLRFINIVVKWPGSTHDALIFSTSRLCRYLERHPQAGWLLGDSGGVRDSVDGGPPPVVFACKDLLIPFFLT